MKCVFMYARPLAIGLLRRSDILTADSVSKLMHDNHGQGDSLIWNFGACRGNNLIKLQVFDF